MLEYYSGEREVFVSDILIAATYHDLGKLDSRNQEAMKNGGRKKLTLNHVDAGTAHLLTNLKRFESALLVYAHHVGLISNGTEISKGRLFMRDSEIAKVTDTHLRNYLANHYQTLESAEEPSGGNCKRTGIERRLSLSCLVDADHSDTARHYGEKEPTDFPKVRWKERIAALDAYVAEKARKARESDQSQSQEARTSLRSDIYQASCEIDPTQLIRSCDAPVGSGKTTAVMAHMLRLAKEMELRHVFVILPYTNIIQQSVETYRKCLVLEGENPEEIVAEHHHQVDFECEDFRYLTTLWKAPIIVTTAVQFFETLSHYKPAQLRKLHELPGSAIFIDESHSALPTHIWPQTWLWLKELCQNWSCRCVLASGSLTRFWNLKEFIEPTEEITDIIPDALRERAIQLEGKRICPLRHPPVLERKELLDFILSKPGPRLVILNTVQSAAVVAHELKKESKGLTLHLSTALCPIHRELIIERIKKLLDSAKNTDWTLVATSCVEAGMDFSFKTAFRESSSTACLIQVGGRVNRNSEVEGGGAVWDFRVRPDGVISAHPDFEDSARILGRLFDEGKFDKLRDGRSSPAEIVTEALRREVLLNGSSKAQEIRKQERSPEYPDVSKLCKIITAETRLVVIDKKIIQQLEDGQKLSSKIIQKNSVRLWSSKLKKLDILPVDGSDELYKWTTAYDPDFLGIVEGLLPLIYAREKGLVI